MTGDLGAADFDSLIEATRRAVESVRTGPVDLPDVRHEAGGPDELVRVTAVLTESGAALDSLHLDPRAMRLNSHDLAERIVRTANEALRGLAGAAERLAVPELDRLVADLHDLQDLSVRRLGAFTDTITDVLGQLERRSE
ncbi:hypothetical protein [Nonomuraea sp. LPB2021202275-12-8]|uniref:hypothetical protein n=1 Tax=Nonomuraea sp. LPB2021202275-12-8 TaxID=3120159 RepID=UPI00300CFE0D